MLMITFAIFYFFDTIACDIYFFEEFTDDSYTTRWIESTHRGVDQGKFQLGAGKYFGDYWKERGLQTSQNSKYYGISAKLEKPFSNKNKPLVIQYQIKLEEPIQCGGGYLKVLGDDFEATSFHGNTPYKIMFGPDICGNKKRMVHVILNYKDKYYLIKRDIKCKDDRFSHLYTLIIQPNNTYAVLIDNKKVAAGKLEDDWDATPPKQIKDPDAVKPADWVNVAKIDDPHDKKPPDWDKPKTIPDPKSKKPETWDEDTDGIWEPPLINNPHYKGEWKPKQMDNPLYKGPWVHPLIDNPNYYVDPDLYLQDSIGAVGFDIWQVIAGSIFDNILITDNPSMAYNIGEANWRTAFDEETRAYEFEKEHERKQQEEFKKLSEERDKLEQDEMEDEIVNENEDSTKTEL